MFQSKEVEFFISDFVRELRDDNVAIFAGAGLSAPSGFVDWKGLMREFSDEIGLDIEKESDLISLAQYYLNRQRGNRYSITKKLVEEFTQDKLPNENHRILARLPISTYWTTNYDRLIEKALIDNRKKPDPKYTKAHFVRTIPKRDAVIYKMHGDIEHLNEVILTKDQYEAYYDTHSPFLNALAGDLSAKTFLFIGYSFNDPNLEYILSRVRVLYRDHQKKHYCFFREIKKFQDESKEDFEYRQIKQRLIIDDLLRFNIHVLLCQEYSDITKVLLEIERRIKQKTVFISGSAVEYGNFGDQGKNFIKRLAGELICQGYKIVSGFGSGVGQFVIEGALNEICYNKREQLTDQLQLFPFPMGEGLEALKQTYRETMIKHAGVSLFIFGNKIEDGALINAPGVIEEFEIAKRNRLLVVPIGATGYAAQSLWETLLAENDGSPEMKTFYDQLAVLGDASLSQEELIKQTLKIIN